MNIEKLERPSRIDEERIQKLKELFPEAFADGKVNFAVLREEIAGLDEELLEENEEEAFGLRWVGKNEARKLAFIPPQGTLKIVEGEGINEKNTKNIFIEGDNLEVLRLLQKSYEGKIKLIYIDPPYNTGNDFVYKDDFQEPVEKYLMKTSQADEQGLLVSNPKSSGRFHANWLNMMYPRLRLARNLLSKDGVIFISIDDNEQANLRLLLNDIFGEENFIGTIVVQSNPRGRHLEKHVATSHEYILIYAKDFEQAIINKSPLTEEQKAEYNQVDEDGKPYRLLGLRKRGAFSTREERPNLHYPIYYSEEKNELSLEKSPDAIEIIPRLSDGTDGVWRWGREKFLEDKHLLVAKKVSGRDEWDVFQKDYLEDDTSRKYKTLWYDKEVNYENGKREMRNIFDGDCPFDTPKPLGLIKKIIQMGMRKNDVVLDFFAGSGTTAHAVLELNKEDGGNRSFILVQLPERTNNDQYPTIAEITKERIRRVIKKLNEQDNNEQQLDRGFSVYKLDKSNLKKWGSYYNEAGIEHLENELDLFTNACFTEGWKENDVVIELMLNQGFPLDSRIEQRSIENNLWIVNHDNVPFSMIVCLDNQIVEPVVEYLINHFRDGLFICIDSALSDQAKIVLSESMKVKTI